MRGKANVKVLNTVKIDPKNPVPIDYNGNAFTYLQSFKYIPFLGTEDILFRNLLELRLLSPTRSNCINDKTFYSVGDGLQVQDQDFPTAFDRKINGKNQTIDDVLRAVFESYYQDGNKFIEIAVTTIGKDTYVHAYPHNNLDCRLEDNDGDDPTHVIRSKNFRRYGIYNFKNQNPTRIPLWTDNPLNKESVWVKEGNTQRTMLHIKNEVQGVDYYGLPSNFSGLANTLLEYKATRFNLDNFDNNMFLGGLLLIQGNLSDTESVNVTKQLKAMYTGEGKGQRILPLSAEGGITDSKFVPFTDTKDGHFLELDKNNVDKIISSDSWSKDLLDLKDSSGLGKGGEYLKQLFKIKFRTVISPAQQNVLNNFIFPFMKIMDEFKGTKFYDLPWTIRPVIPVSLEGVLDVNSLLTVDEGRAEIGKGDLPNGEGKKIISTVKPVSAPQNNNPNDQPKPAKN